MERRYYNREIETMSREDFLKWQWQQVKKQVEYTYAHSGLCRRQFQKAGITPDDINSWDDFRNKVPFTGKQDLLTDQQEKPPYGTRLSVPEGEIFVTYLTSGTSGKGQEVHTDSREDWSNFVEGIAMKYHWCGWQKGDKVMNPLPLGITVAAPLHYLAPYHLGCNVFNLGMFDTKTKIEYMRRFKICGFFSTVAYLDTMTAEAEQMGLDPARDLYVRKILTAIQAWPVSFMQKMKEKWHAEIYDYYGSTQHAEACTCENGPVIGDRRGYYHMYQHFALHEVINPETQQLVGEGEIGEIVMTPLNKKASPFLRFRSADRVRYFPHTYCDCGRPFDLLEAGTVARYDDMMKIKGLNIWPETIDEIVFTKNETSEYQGRLFISDDRKEKAEVKIEFKKDVAPAVKQNLLKKIAAEIHDATGINFEVKESPEPLPHSVFKIRRWQDEREKGLEK